MGGVARSVLGAGALASQWESEAQAEPDRLGATRVQFWKNQDYSRDSEVAERLRRAPAKVSAGYLHFLALEPANRPLEKLRDQSAFLLATANRGKAARVSEGATGAPNGLRPPAETSEEEANRLGPASQAEEAVALELEAF